MGTEGRLRSSVPAAYKVHPGGEDEDTDDQLADNKEFVEEETSIAVSAIVKWWRMRRLNARIKNKWTPEQLREMHEAQRRKRIRLRIRDLLVHIVFVCVFYVATLGSFDESSPYYFLNNVKELFTRSVFYTHNNTTLSTFEDIHTIDQLHTWLQGPFYHAIYGTASSINTDSIQNYGQLVGGVSIGQIRVQRQNCTSRYPSGVTSNSSVYYCYGTTSGLYSSSVESTDAFGTGSGSDFTWAQSTDVIACRDKFFSSTHTASNIKYPCPAFVQILPQSSNSTAMTTLSTLQRYGYIDLATRLVIIEVNIANVMLGQVLVLHFHFEFPPGGGIIPSTAAKLAPYLTNSFDFTSSWSDILVGLFYLYFVAQLLTSARKVGWPAFRSLAPWVDILNVLAYIVMWLLRTTMALDFPATSITSDTFTSFKPYADMFTLSQSFAAATSFLSFFRLILHLDMLPHVQLVVQIVIASVVEVISFLFVFGLFVYAFSTSYVLVFGSKVQSFSTVTKSYGSLLQSLVGNLEYQKLYDANPTMAPFLFAIFSLVAIFVVLTIVVAMMQDAYWKGKIRTNWEKINLVYETISYLWSVSNSALHSIANWFGLAAILESHAHRHRKSLAVGDVPKVPVRLSTMQSLVLKPLLSTQETLSRVGSHLSKSHLIKNGVEQLKRGTSVMTSAKDHLVSQIQNAVDGVVDPKTQYASGTHPMGYGGASDEQIKALQGMIVQLAHQNAKIQHTLVNLQAQIADLRQGDGIQPDLTIESRLKPPTT